MLSMSTAFPSVRDTTIRDVKECKEKSMTLGGCDHDAALIHKVGGGRFQTILYGKITMWEAF
jgi:hypothetical protein